MHERIRSDIEQQILSGALAPGDRLPVEHELMITYGCSRMTVNKAISALSTAGLIERRKRAGSFVAHPRLHSMVLDVPDLMQEIVDRGQDYRFALTGRRIILAEGNPRDGADFGPGRMLELTGLHYADGRPLALERRLVNIGAVPDIEHASFDDQPPGSWLLRHVPWTEAETRISAVAAEGEAAAALDLPLGAPLLRIERRTWRGEDRITAVRQSFRADAYDLFARFKTHEAAARSG